MVGKPNWSGPWCWRCGDVMTDLPDIRFTFHALIEPLHPVIPQPTLLVTLLCFFIFFPFVFVGGDDLYYLPNARCFSWTSKLARRAIGCKKSSGMLYILTLRALMAVVEPDWIPIDTLPRHHLNNEDTHSNHIRPRLIHRDGSSRKETSGVIFSKEISGANQTHKHRCVTQTKPQLSTRRIRPYSKLS